MQSLPLRKQKNNCASGFAGGIFYFGECKGAKRIYEQGGACRSSPDEVLACSQKRTGVKNGVGSAKEYFYHQP